MHEHWLKADYALIKAALADTLVTSANRTEVRNFASFVIIALLISVVQVQASVAPEENGFDVIHAPRNFAQDITQLSDTVREELPHLTKATNALEA